MPKSRVESRESRVVRWSEISGSRPSTLGPRPAIAAFTLVEVLVVVVLMSFIILALMAVFNSTQAAFRASITQTDVLEGGRAAMGLIKSDFESMTPSFGVSNSAVGAANFYSSVITYPSPPSPLFQSLGSVQLRINILENFFILSRVNLNGQDSWVGTGYAVATNLPSGQPSLYSLYRYTTNHPVSGHDPAQIFTNDFANFFYYPTNGSHLMDGVVHLTVRAYDPNGLWMTNTYAYPEDRITTNKNVWFFLLNRPSFLPGPGSGFGETGFWMFSNALPASVEIQLGVLEDRTLQRAESIPDSNTRSNYLAQHAGQVHLFRQRILIRNVDPSAYQ